MVSDMRLRPLAMALCATSSLLAAGMASAQAVSGYLVDSSGNPVRSGFGSCLRTGSWSAAQPGIGCDASPDRVVLLPDPDGKVGAVVVRSAAGEKVLDTAYAGAEVVKGGAITPRQESAEGVQARYGSVLGATPPRPVSFVVNFATGSAAELTPESAPVIAAIKAELSKRPAPEITVIGHTDRVGKLEGNDELSKRRAEAVRDILSGDGIKAASMEVAGRGEREPVVATADEVAEARNRRVEISIR